MEALGEALIKESTLLSISSVDGTGVEVEVFDVVFAVVVGTGSAVLANLLAFNSSNFFFFASISRWIKSLFTSLIGREGGEDKG